MKSAMPFHGVTAPRLKQALRPILAAYAPGDRATWEATVRELWDGATHREERYAATALARHRAARAWQDPAALDLYRHLVVTGAWWDHVDEVAAHLVGGVLAGHRPEVTPVMRAWARDDDLWVRRTAVLGQLRSRRRPTPPCCTRDELLAASPLSRVSPAAPPILSLTGDLDICTTVADITVFHEALDDAGVRNELVVFKGRDHGFDFHPTDWVVCLDRMVAFLDSLWADRT